MSNFPTLPYGVSKGAIQTRIVDKRVPDSITWVKLVLVFDGWELMHSEAVV